MTNQCVGIVIQNPGENSKHVLTARERMASRSGIDIGRMNLTRQRLGVKDADSLDSLRGTTVISAQMKIN